MKNKSYAETKSDYVYNWPNIIHNIKHGFYTESEKQEWVKAAHSWVTCACGSQCESLSRGLEGEPLDGRLNFHGNCFFREIHASFSDIAYCDQALETLSLIEKRATELLREQS